MSPDNPSAPPERGPRSAPISSADKGPRSTPISSADKGPRSTPLSSNPSLEGFPLAVFRELTRFLSEPNARALLLASASAAGVAVGALTPAHAALINAQIIKTFDTFGLGSETKSHCLFNLRSLARSAFPQTEIVIPIHREDDIVSAREAGKQTCIGLGFSEVAYVKVATAISELARNILKYAGSGSVAVRVLPGQRAGVEIVATDHGPGIPDIEAVLSPRYRSRSGMGVGLRGTRRLMEHFEIKSQPGSGTTVTIRKYIG